MWLKQRVGGDCSVAMTVLVGEAIHTHPPDIYHFVPCSYKTKKLGQWIRFTLLPAHTNSIKKAIKSWRRARNSSHNAMGREGNCFCRRLSAGKWDYSVSAAINLHLIFCPRWVDKLFVDLRLPDWAHPIIVLLLLIVLAMKSTNQLHVWCHRLSRRGFHLVPSDHLTSLHHITSCL